MPRLKTTSMLTRRKENRLYNIPGDDHESSSFASVPIELKEMRAWLPFKITPRQDAETKKAKIPHNNRHKRAKYTDPREWMTFEAACEMLRSGSYDGIGIVIDRSFGIVGYDADSCVSDGVISDRARDHVAVLNTYSEISVSGTGLHCLAYGALPPAGRKKDGFEMYCDKRFFVVTGRHLPGTPHQIEQRQIELAAVHEDLFGSEPVREPTKDSLESVTQFPPITQLGGTGGIGGDECQFSSLSDDTVVRLLKQHPLAWKYFSDGAGTTNPSRADFALGCKLAFYTGGNLEQMYRLFMRSALGKRRKCRTMRGKINYVEYTLRKCLRSQKVFWQPSSRAVCTSNRPVGRPLSPITLRVIDARRQNPSLRPCEIAKALGLNPATVRKVLSRYSVATHLAKSDVISGTDTECQKPGPSSETVAYFECFQSQHAAIDTRNITLHSATGIFRPARLEAVTKHWQVQNCQEHVSFAGHPKIDEILRNKAPPDSTGRIGGKVDENKFICTGYMACKLGKARGISV
jgi:putative DNA primase/helicase